MKYEARKEFTADSGAKVTVTIGSDSPINESDWLLLREDVAVNMANNLTALAEVMKPTR